MSRIGHPKGVPTITTKDGNILGFSPSVDGRVKSVVQVSPTSIRVTLRSQEAPYPFKREVEAWGAKVRQSSGNKKVLTVSR